MKFAEKPTQSAEYLRQAIPLMVKYKIPPNPLNYALWYTYVSMQSPKLNQEIDKALDTYGTCPTLICEEMFREYLIKDETNDADGFQTQVVSLVNNLHKKAGIASQCASEFQEVLENSLAELKDEQSIYTHEQIIENLSLNTDSISQSTHAFQRQISKAQAEIERLKKELKNSKSDPRIDQPTKLFNRQYYDIEIEQLVQMSTDVNACIAIFELDEFQQFNESFGEAMGDKIIVFIANLVKNHCPSPSIAIRFSGPRFAMILFDKDLIRATEVAQALSKKIAAIRLRPKDANMINHKLSVSFGISQKRANDTAEIITQRVLEALKQAKSSASNIIAID
ncbi:GGDEF domain-containing protein [Gammaproteobacteria bacterium AS21]|jgi:diguanylate cyclase